MADPEDEPAGRVDRLLGVADHVRMLWSVAPVRSTICLIGTLLGAGCDVLNMVAVGRLVGALAAVLTGGPTGPLWLWFGVFAGGALLAVVIGSMTSWAGAGVTAGYRTRLDELIAETGLWPRDLAVLEDDRFAERLEGLAGNSRTWLLRFGMAGTWEFLGAKLGAVGAAIIVLGWHWWVPLVVIASYIVAARVTSRWLDDLLDNIYEKPNLDRRRSDYIGRLMIQPRAAKEIRIFGMTRWLEQRYVQLWRAAQSTFWGRANGRLAVLCLVLVLQTGVIGGALALLAVEAYRGEVSPASVTTLVIAVLGLQALGPLGDVETGLIRTTVFLRSLGAARRSVGLPRLQPVEPPPLPTPSGDALPIDIDDLTFGYPSRSEPTLRELSLHVPAGQSLAVVGVNGAGKSTLIKLIAGLYRPAHGTVRVGGRDPYADDDSRGSVAVVFQDFVQYPLSLRDNVGFGAMGRAQQPVLDKAIEDAAGTGVLDQLRSEDRDGWDAVLSPEFQGGTDLSGGQWQRIALARALAAVGGGAGVLVLDEPTAALDVRAEAEIFDRFLQRTSGVTTILVSHRLSTVRRAERIVVLDGDSGRISEDGTHEELMAAGGAYAEMFTLQASRFAAAGASDPGRPDGDGAA